MSRHERRGSLFASVVGAMLMHAACGCAVRALPAGAAPLFAADVEPILKERCVRCHGGDAPAAHWSADSYLGAIACTPSGAPATVAAHGEAPILSVLKRDDHAHLLDSHELAVLRAWVHAGAPSRGSGQHPAGWLDPRDSHWHGKALRDEGFAPMLSLRAKGACGTCHEGTPAQSAKLTATEPRAPACTSCHQAEKGVLACGTCHGDGAERAYPPRDACFFPSGPPAGAHAAHVNASKLRAGKLACTTCHPAVDADAPLTGRHADGTVDVVFDAALAGSDASYDAQTGTCTVRCHTRQGARAHPSWTEDHDLGCGDCHSSPPADHFPGMCSKCHPGVNDDGTAFLDASLHINGRVDLGHDGSRRCGSCHGDGADDPWPTTRAHPAHRNPSIAQELACTNCHRVPQDVLDEGHIDRSPGPELTFGGLATARDAQPSYDAQTATCSEVACHGARLPGTVAATPSWHDAAPGDAQCGSCHGLPPSAPHTSDPSCEASLCHGNEVARWPSGPRLTGTGQVLHVNGALDFGRP